METQLEFDQFMSKLNSLIERCQRGESIEEYEQIDLLLSCGTAGKEVDDELRKRSQRLKNRKNNLNKLLGK